MYKKIYDPFTKTDSDKFIRKYSPIPMDISISEENSDYQEYLKWVAEGNTLQPADEPQE